MLRTLFRRARASRPRAGVRSRVTLPSVRTPHPDVLRDMRTLGWGLDYYVQRDGRVLLLNYEPNKPRIFLGQILLMEGIRTIDAQLQAVGFALLEDLPPTAIDSGLLLNRCRQIAYALAHPAVVEQEHQRLLAETNGTAAEARVAARWHDRLDAERRSDHSIFFRHRKSFSGSSH